MSAGTSIWKYFKKDAVASILVVPVSLMIAIGLSTVAHAPTESAIIALVVGGIITSIFGGSFVNISGAGIHSAAVWMMGAIVLGNGEFGHGYKLMLASGVIVGLLMIVIGLLRQTQRLDIIPISVRRGIISMLGVWILISQIPPLLGESAYLSYDSLGAILATYPDLLDKAVNGDMDYWISGVGLIALMFMIFYSSYQNRLIRMLPAPLWLLIGGVVFSFYLQIIEGNAFLNHLNQQVHLNQIGTSWIHSPDWTMIGQFKFWAVTLGFLMVTLNESVTNLRSTDRLDLLHRRSDINTEITALGLASVLSCAIGGLNVTATIVQSSTNIQLKAMSRWSNVLNAVGLLVLVVAIGGYLENLLLPFVSAMMLYVGYRMAAPSHLRAIADIGWEDLFGLAAAFAIGWMYGIFYGLLAGIVLIFILQLITSGKAGLILRFAFRPNTLLYQESDAGYLLSIKHYGNFLNLGRIREKIDSVPSSSEMIVDFSLAEFVDENVLRQLEYYEEIFSRRGGRFEIVGIDDLRTTVHHQFASWMPFGAAPTEEGPLSSRQEALAELAEAEGYEYRPHVLYSGQPFYAFQYFRSSQIEGQRNRLTGELEGLPFVLSDVDYHEGEFVARGTSHSTMLSMEVDGKVPQFVLDRERLLDRVASLAGFSDINFEEHPKFSAKFHLQGANESAIRSFFSDELIDLLNENPYYHIEARGQHILIFEKERLAGANEIKGLISFASELAAFLKKTE
ncbi:MAG: SulP family inorganic anion transporter [Flavobacteriia bacterium]|nr:SulP family inorganic anion transporter [Flavobacteriia bacterium]